MDEGTNIVPLIEITPGDIRASEAWLELDNESAAGGRLGFIERDHLNASTNGLGRKGFVQLGIECAALMEELARGEDPVIVSGSITRTSTSTRDLDAAPFRLAVSVGKAVRQLEVTLKLDEQAAGGRLNLANLRPAVDGHVALARIRIAQEGLQRWNAAALGDVRFNLNALLILGNEWRIPASLRPHRLRQDESQLGWLNADGKLSAPLELDAETGRFAVDTIDIGIPHAQLRRWLGRPGGRTLDITAAMWFRRNDDANPFQEWQPQDARIEFTGELLEALIFSGLCEPRSVSLAGVPAGSTYKDTLPDVWISKSGDEGTLRLKGGRYFHQLLVQHDGGASDLGLQANVTLHAGGQPIPGASLDPFNDTLGAAGALGSAGSPPVRCAVPVDLSRLLRETPPHADEGGELTCEIRLEVARGAEAAHIFKFTIPLKVERTPVDWLACIDFGASCTAISIGRGRDRAGMFLPLGDWLADINPLHDESGFHEPSSPVFGSQSRKAPRFLLPSHIGLSPDVNLRTGWDPLSLGDLSLVLPAAAGYRLKHLKRSYDISVPFPSREGMAEHYDTIITQPKKLMIQREDTVRLAPVFSRLPESDEVKRIRDVKLGDVIEECFEELGGYVAVSALYKMLAGDAPDETARRLARERVQGSRRFGAVVTHPSGIQPSRREIYHRAGLRFVTAFAGPAAEASLPSDVMLVPEAMAAARYGIQKFIDSETLRGTFVSGREQTFITLDIGAGTYDVTVIDATVTTDGVSAWRVQSHFGLALGGADLDKALNSAVKNILAAAAAEPEFQDVYEIEPGFPLDQSDSLGVTKAGRDAIFQLRTQVQIGKTRLSQQLLDRRGPDEPYVWRDNGEPLQVRVGRPGDDHENWPVRRLHDDPSWDAPPAELRGDNFRLVCETAADGIRLDIWPGALQNPSTHVADLVRFMGTALPETAFKEHLNRGQPLPAHPPVWIVTGRTALWPPLLEAIRRFIDGTAGAGSLLSSCPFAPDQMKQAVVYGAFDLARTPWLLDDNTPPNPLAIIEYAGEGQDGRSGRWGRGEKRKLKTIRPVSDGDEFYADGPFAIARVIPSLTRSDDLPALLELIRRVGITPWVDLTGEISHEKPGLWRMTCRRDAARASVHLTIRNPSGEDLTLGPFQEGRVYGP